MKNILASLLLLISGAVCAAPSFDTEYDKIDAYYMGMCTQAMPELQGKYIVWESGDLPMQVYDPIEFFCPYAVLHDKFYLDQVTPTQWRLEFHTKSGIITSYYFSLLASGGYQLSAINNKAIDISATGNIKTHNFLVGQRNRLINIIKEHEEPRT